MCLSIAVDEPHRVLAQGNHLGYDWVVTTNHMACRCGYIRVGPDHPWHGKDLGSLEPYPLVHGGITFTHRDKACDKDGPDDGWWIGFDCAHYYDLPDPDLFDHPGVESDTAKRMHGIYSDVTAIASSEATTKSQGYVEDECFRLIEQAIEVA